MADIGSWEFLGIKARCSGPQDPNKPDCDKPAIMGWFDCGKFHACYCKDCAPVVLEECLKHESVTCPLCGQVRARRPPLPEPPKCKICGRPGPDVELPFCEGTVCAECENGIQRRRLTAVEVTEI